MAEPGQREHAGQEVIDRLRFATRAIGWQDGPDRPDEIRLWAVPAGRWIEDPDGRTRWFSTFDWILLNGMAMQSWGDRPAIAIVPPWSDGTRRLSYRGFAVTIELRTDAPTD